MTGHELLDDHLAAGIAELSFAHDLFRAAERFLQVPADQDALAERKTGCLQDNREGRLRL
jgi:hypothetical protein